MTNGVIEDVAVIGALIGVQFLYAINSLFLSYLMSLGIGAFAIVIFTSFAQFLILSPIATYFERTHWPKKFRFKLLIQMSLLALGGVTLFQSLYLKGIKLTSPAMATAMPNLAPGLIFVIAWACRLEKVKLNCTYSKVKILGTLLCVIGALTMSIMHSTTTSKAQLSSSSSDFVFDKEKIIGCVYLMAAIFVLSISIVLQASTLREFPAPMSLAASISLIGVFMTSGIQVLEEHKLVNNWPISVSVRDMIIYSIVGGAVSGTCISVNGWAMKKRGPVLVSMFSPVATVISVIFSAFTLEDSFNGGSFGGMFVMFTGLYLVLWAKGKEGYASGADLEPEFDAEKPLLN